MIEKCNTYMILTTRKPQNGRLLHFKCYKIFSVVAPGPLLICTDCSQCSSPFSAWCPQFMVRVQDLGWQPREDIANVSILVRPQGTTQGELGFNQPIY